MSHVSSHKQRPCPDCHLGCVKENPGHDRRNDAQMSQVESQIPGCKHNHRCCAMSLGNCQSPGCDGEFKQQTLRPPAHAWKSLPVLACPLGWKHRKVFPASLSKALGPLASFPRNGGYQINYVWLCPLLLPFDCSGVRESEETTREAFTCPRGAWKPGRSCGLNLKSSV